MRSVKLLGPCLVAAVLFAVGCGDPAGSDAPAADESGPGAAAALPLPSFHHIHVNSTDPERALDWWSTFWPAGERTTVAGMPAFAADGVALVYTPVEAPAPGAFDPERRPSIPQSPFWTTGPSTDGLALYERLTALDPEGERFGFLPVYTGPDDTEGVPHSGLAPFGDQLLTVAEMAERAVREGSNPTRDRGSGQDFGYVVDPDGILRRVQRQRRDRGPLLRPHPLLARAAALRRQLVRRAPRRDDPAGAIRAVRRRDR